MNDCSIGIDLGGTRLLLRCGEAEEISGTGWSFAPEQLISRLGSFIRRHGIDPERIGLAIPGLVEPCGRVAACDVLPSFRGWQAGDAMRTLCTRVAVVNDVEAAMLEEMHDAPSDITGGVIMVGTAVGAAFIMNGEPLRGASGWAGELGYLPMACDHGVTRLDELAGGAAIAASCGLAPEELARRARDGDAVILRVIAGAGASLGLGLAAVINLLNPSRLSVGGGTSELPGYWEAACASAKRHALPESWRDCTLSRVGAGRSVVVLGALRAAAS